MSNNHFDRSEITKLAIDAALAKTDLKEFDSITHIGDGLWDFASTIQLGINFIGIDRCNDQKLTEAGARCVAKDLNDLDQIITWVNSGNKI